MARNFKYKSVVYGRICSIDMHVVLDGRNVEPGGSVIIRGNLPAG